MLKYLFTAHFTDGTSFEQPSDDVSLLDSKRSAFFDLLAQMEDKQIASFALVGEGHVYAVDLIDGHFEIDNIPFWAMPKDLPAEPERFKLVYYRRHTHQFTLNRDEIGHDVRFVLGWECNVNGKTHQQTIGVD